VSTSQICGAIASKRVVRFAYAGGLRTVEPHAHGWSAAGVELLRGYQTFGFSTSGEATGWKTFHVDKIAGLRVEPETFPTRPEFNRDEPGFGRLCCAV
jgi:hypothetical protein